MILLIFEPLCETFLDPLGVTVDDLHTVVIHDGGGDHFLAFCAIEDGEIFAVLIRGESDGREVVRELFRNDITNFTHGVKLLSFYTS